MDPLKDTGQNTWELGRWEWCAYICEFGFRSQDSYIVSLYATINIPWIKVPHLTIYDPEGTHC